MNTSKAGANKDTQIMLPHNAAGAWLTRLFSDAHFFATTCVTALVSAFETTPPWIQHSINPQDMLEDGVGCKRSCGRNPEHREGMFAAKCTSTQSANRGETWHNVPSVGSGDGAGLSLSLQN
jgi:hypothetical protein